MHRALVGLSAILLLCSCERSANRGKAVDAGASTAAVNSVEGRMLAAFQEHDPSRLAQQYARDAILAVPYRTTRGSAEIRAALERDFADPAFRISFANERTEVARADNLAFTHGTYRHSFTNSRTNQVVSGTGTYVTVFRREPDGSWRVVADIATPGRQD